MNYDQWRHLLQSEHLPAALLDLDAVDTNLATLTGALSRTDVTLRIASKSLRHTWLLRYLLKAGGRQLCGLMTFSAMETQALAEVGFDDFLLAYPIARPREARALAETAATGKKILAMVDNVTHVKLLQEAARDADTTLGLCMDVDASLTPMGTHIGVKRSPIRTVDAALALAQAILTEPNVELRGLMSYEAQVAGLPDHNPLNQPALDPLRRFIKGRSIPVVRARRNAIVSALRDAGHPIELVNGGGTGSIRSSSEDPVVTEVTAGSGFVTSHLFDGYDGLPLQPALFFALPIVRHPDQDHVTCFGGGYIASGAAGADRLPMIHAPAGVQPLNMEGFGEVQTPLRKGSQAPRLGVGDPIICRHAKAGELAERFGEYLLYRESEVIGREPTYRGLGWCFG